MNDSLIKAAPDLLRAAELTEKWWLEEGMQMSKDAGHIGAGAWIFYVRAAILKARGRPDTFGFEYAAEALAAAPADAAPAKGSLIHTIPEPAKAAVTDAMVEAGALRLAAINGNRPDAWKHYEDDARECLVAALSATPPEDAT